MDKTKKKKKWGRRNLVEVKEGKFIKKEKKFMRQHQRTEKKQQLDRFATTGEEIFQRFTKASTASSIFILFQRPSIS